MSVAAIAHTLSRRRRRGGSAAPPSLALNVSALPVANRQPTDWAWHNSVNGPGGCAGGAATLDSVTGCYSLRLTAAAYPVANTGGQLDYASTGPHISLPDTDGSVYVCFAVYRSVGGTAYYTSKLTRGAPPSMSTPVELPIQPTRDTLNVFSRNPATPWLLMILTESPTPRVRAVDVRTNTEVFSAGGATFPVLMPALNGLAVFWFTTSDDHSRLCAYGGVGSEVVAVYNSATGAVVRTQPASFFEAGLGGASFNECSISPSGRYVRVNYSTADVTTIWDLETGFLSANYASGSALNAHTSWALGTDGEYVVGEDSSDGFIGRQRYMRVQPITSAGASPGTWTTANPAQVNRTMTQHTSTFWRRTATGDQQYTLGSPFIVATTHPAPGTWSSLGGGVWQTTADISGGIRQATGIVDVWECGAIGGSGYGNAIATLTRRADGTTALNAQEWAVDAPSGTTQVVRVRLTNGLTPAGRVHLATSAVNNHAVALVRLDNGDSRLVARTHSLPYPSDYAAMDKPQVGPGRAPWVLYNTNHGIIGGRVDVVAVQLPVT